MPERRQESTPHLFVSYASVDRERVLPVVDTLRNNGIEVWLDEDDIAGGTIYAAEIAAGIEGCRALALMCTSAALASHNVRQEIALAWKYRRPYLPLLLEPVTIPRELEYWLEGSQWIELFDRPVEHWMPQILTALDRAQVDRPRPATASSNLAPVFDVPAPLTPIVGREDEVRTIAKMIQSARILTLTGPGGTGKTRLALAVAEELRDQVDSDIVFVDLAPVRDSGFVIPTVATRLGIQAMGDQPVLTTLTQALARREVLLMLDNLEQVIDAAPEIAALLAGAPKLRVLATSRAPLQVSGEQEYLVAPLAVPGSDGDVELEHLAGYAAVQLFVQRAQSIRPDFQITGDNAATIAEICVRLDGLPLAIELAAARIRMLSPQALLGRLERRLPLLTGGRRDLPNRQQTLRNTIDWSHDLLQPDEQALLRSLSLFAGGWTLEAAGAVAGDDIDVFSGLEALVNQHLVDVNDAPEPRYSMLETIREYGLDQLAISGNEEAMRERHARWVLNMVAEVAPQTNGPRLIDAMNQLAAEHANIRTALDWYGNRQNAEAGWRIAGPLWIFWWMRNHLREAHQHYQRLLGLPREGVPAEVLALGLTGAGIIHEWLDIPETATQLQEDALEVWKHLPDDLRTDEFWSHVCLSNIAMRRGDLDLAVEHDARRGAIAHERGDHRQLATSKILSGTMAMMSGNPSEAVSIYREALAHARQSGDPWAIALILGNLINALLTHDEHAEVGQDLDEAIALNRAMDNQYQLVQSLELRAEVASRQGRHQDALADVQQARTLARRFGNAYTECECLISSGMTLLRLNQIEEAREYFRDSLRLLQEHDMPELRVAALEGMGHVLHAMGQPQRAIRILGAADAFRSAHGSVLVGTDLAMLDQLLASLQSALPESEYASEWAAGAAMSMDDASAYALDQK